jgi:integrase
MDLQQPDTTSSNWQYAGENLRRRKSSGVYYVFVKRKGKQICCSLKTTDKVTAIRLKKAHLDEVDHLASAEAAQITFDALAARWIESERHTLKPSSAERREACVKAIAPAFLGLQIRNITAQHCESWAVTRGRECASATFKKELEAMRGAFRFATAHGLIIRDPSKSLKFPKIRTKPPAVPTRSQFEAIVSCIRSDGQGKGDEGANLVELLAYSGMRLGEARSLRWRDVNFSAGVFTVTGGERGPKNDEQRTTPIFPDLLAFLMRLKKAIGKASPEAFVIQTASARKCMETACRKLGLPHFRAHHSWRHFAATCAIESGVDIPTVAHWLGHKDGGALLMRTYSHLRMPHSIEQAKRVSFHAVPETTSDDLK